MKVIESNIIYENPLPQLRSRQAAFPFLFQNKDGVIGAVYCIGEAFESTDKISYISFSHDGGKSWSAPEKLFDNLQNGIPYSNCFKAIALKDGRIVGIGYAFDRRNPDLPLGNPVTGGLLDDVVYFALSEDGGKTWTDMMPIECAWGPHVEASAPLVELRDGAWITPITGFPDWEGRSHGKNCGRALRSEDGGKTWNDDVICMDFGDEPITCYEQRMCQLASGAIINIGWNENTATGERLPNHYTVSYDNGKTWTAPESTGIMGQASSVCALGGEKFLALHAIRRDTDAPGVYGYVVDFSDKTWKIMDSALIWAPNTPVVKDSKMAEIFAFLKFGQPGAILLDDGDVLMCHWFAEQGQYKTVVTRIKL